MIDRSAAAIKRSVNGPLRSEQMIEQSSQSPRSEAIERPIPIQGSQPKRPEQPSIDRRSPPASQQASGASNRRSIPSERSDRRSTAATAATAAIDRTTATAPRSNTRSPPEPLQVLFIVPSCFCGGAISTHLRRLHGGDSPTYAISKGGKPTPRLATPPDTPTWLVTKFRDVIRCGRDCVPQA
jgi:hypothetical protein